MCRVVLVDLPALELQRQRRHVGEHLVAELHVVAGDVGHLQPMRVSAGVT